MMQGAWIQGIPLSPNAASFNLCLDCERKRIAGCLLSLVHTNGANARQYTCELTQRQLSFVQAPQLTFQDRACGDEQTSIQRRKP